MDLREKHLLSRRHFCLCCMTGAAFAATGGWLTPRQAFAEARGIVTLIKDSAASSPVTAHKLRGNVSVLEGSGGNIAVLIAHENTRKHLAGIQRVADWDYNFLPSPAGAIPSEVLSANRTLKLNGTSIELKPYKPAHTDGDLSVTFGDADVLHVADTYWNGIYPFIDYSTGGSIDGMIAASDANLAAATENTIIIPGHGKPVSNKAELKEFRDMLVAIRDSVAALKKVGRTLEETVAAKPTAAHDAKWGQFVIDPPFFTKLVYEGV